MNRFWTNIILPIIKGINASYIVEVGSDTGINTENILEYCMEHNAHMAAIDPFPRFDVDEFKAKYGDKFEIYTELSLNRLPLLGDYDVILLDGDHNWYTLYNELKVIEGKFKDKKFPIVFLHDIGWPYARRDLYYNPEDIPEVYRQPYKKLGMYPGKTELQEVGLNAHLYNAIYENNAKNGVLTAIEDFISESNLEFSFKFINAYHGLGILFSNDDETENIVKNVIKSAGLLDNLEEERVKLEIARVELKDAHAKSKKLLEKELDKNRTKLRQTEDQLKSSNQLIQNKQNHIYDMEKKEKKLVNELNVQTNNLKASLIEIEYLNNKNRSVTQRFISKFPSLYILFNMNETGIKNALVNIKGYNAIKKDNLFDIGYYLKNNNNIRLSGIDPILHYIYHGFKEGKNPSSSFDGNYYLKTYKSVKKSNLNPLVHYSLYGRYEEKKTKNQGTLDVQKNSNFLEFMQYSNYQINNILTALDPDKKISVIIPVYNAYEDTKKCIDSVLKNTKIPYEMILIDDCSPDKRIKTLLDEMEKVPHVKVIRNHENKGFVKTVNIGIQNSEGDVVLLNSDTIVTPKWLQKLVVSAYSDERIGTVTPFSNASDISVPEMGKNNEIPEFLTLNEMASLVEKVSLYGNIEAPTGNGFCLFIKRETIDDVGLFDEENFGHGYGEETDFCMRAKYRNWKNARNDSIFIYHKRNVSFSKEKKDILQKKNKQIIEAKHPTVYKEWAEFKSSKKLRGSINNIKAALNEFNPVICKKRILYVSSLDSNGVPSINNDFLEIKNTFDTIILTINAKTFELWKYKDDNFSILAKSRFESDWDSDDFRKLYFNLLVTFNVDALVIRKFFIIKDPNYRKYSNFIRIAHKLGLKLVYEATCSNVLNDLERIDEYQIQTNDLNDKAKIDFRKEKMAVYTAITGDYDNLAVPEYINDNFDYICFTDNKNLKSDFWEIRLMEDLDLDNTKKARHYKALPHLYLSEYDYSIWMDGAFKITGNLENLINEYAKNKTVMCIVHDERDCIYGEANTCLERKMDSEDIILAQMNKYKAEGFPENQGLISSGVLFRKHNDPSVIKLMNEWYNEINNHSKRDQLSFNYICWKNDFEYDKCDRFVWNNEYFIHKGSHKNEKSKEINQGNTHKGSNKKKKSEVKRRKTLMNFLHKGSNKKKKSEVKRRKLSDGEVLVYDVSPLELQKNHELMENFKENPNLQLKRALWFVPFFDHVYRGGIYTIFRTAQHFSIREGTKNIFVLKGGKERKLNEVRKELSEAFPDLNFELINLKEYGNEADLPYSDAAFCTLWITAYNLVKYNNCRAKFYFNQDYEPLFYSAGSIYGLIEQTYRFGFIGVTNTKGVAESYKKYNKCVNYFTPAVDTNIFYPDTDKMRNDKLRVVFYGRPNNPRNGFRLGIEALKKVKAHFKDKVEIFSVGSEFDAAEYGLDGVLENLGLLPTIEDVAELYRTCDVGLVFMFTPHPSYQPLEYMASGCATVTNINESNLWLLKDKENSILTEPTVSLVATNIIKLLENYELRKKIIKNGLEIVSSTNWEDELDKLCNFIKNPKLDGNN